MAILPPDLEKERRRICKLAEDAGLDFFETIFEMVKYEQINQIAAYGGFPVRYPHWRFGMDYERLSKSYEYGLSKIYEMVINTNPCYAYLMEGNSFMDQKLVMAHVYGHCDFFKNNKWFSKTDRKMIDTMANHATRVRKYMDRYGVDVVEDFIDRCLSIENLIDRYAVYSEGESNSEEPAPREELDQYLLKVDRDYMKHYINPPEFIREQKQKLMEERNRERKFPPRPEKDILNFLIHFAPLESWQQDILSIIRNESIYFSPQGMTKTMNEGWASYWHTKLMTESILEDSEVIDYADHHSGTVAMSPNSYNPYKVGIELFRDIEERWNKGQFGREWEECDDQQERRNWDRKLGIGREKIFEIRRVYNDVTFIDEFLSEDFCVRNKLFVYQFNKRTGQFEVDTRNFPAIKKQLLFHMTNYGQPIITIEDANFENRGELLLTHLYEGIDMQPDYMSETLKNIQALWGRPVNIATVMDNEGQLYRYDGKEIARFPLSDQPKEEKEEGKPQPQPQAKP